MTESIQRGSYPNITTAEIDILASETAASKSTLHPDYTKLASAICINALQKTTPDTFTKCMEILYNDHDIPGNGFISHDILKMTKKYGEEINQRIKHDNDYTLSYFGYKTLEKSYLLKTELGQVMERPQYMLMRVALGIHCCSSIKNNKNGEHDDDDDDDDDVKVLSEEEELENLKAAFETYDMMSNGYFTHASPTLFHAGTKHPQLSSCFLVQMSDDSIDGIYDTLKRCAVISKSAGGIGLSVHNIRARGSYISGTRGVSNGLVPMLRVYDVTSRYVDQGGGKRPGAFAIYIEPWHADIFDVLNLKKNHGKEEQRARDLFYGLWVSDLFMKRVKNDEMWSLMCPHQCPGLSSCYGAEFNALYEEYERKGKFLRQVRARELWGAILDAQIETGTPYLLYKDAANEKSNQKNLGTIQCSNLCTEIIQYTDEKEVAVCNLASM
jgi:ribonucleotide reductase alpha subunit